MEKELLMFLEKINSLETQDRDRIRNALGWALEQAGIPASGSRSILPVIGAASILIDLSPDPDTIIASLILSCLKDRTVSESITESFGSQTALLVKGVTRIADISAKNKTLHEAENIRNMLFAMAEDIRVILIKLAEKLHALRVLDSAPAEVRKPAAQECLDIYAPLANRLGISWIKDELEDLSLKYLNRDVYQQIKDIVAAKRGERDQFLNWAQEAVKKESAAAGIKIEVDSRAKHFYSIYMKMRRRNKSAADIYDLFGIRILCDNIENCYTMLGLVHRLWKPIDGRFKDYIAMPKSNGYQSLHTTVISASEQVPLAVIGNEPGQNNGDEGRLLEIQIRTKEMHHVAENGIASHWLYKKGASREIVRPLDISIVNRVRNWKQNEDEQGEALASTSYLEDIKREILRDSIYVFTPQGKVIELPAGATPIDFAYCIHSAIGEHCIGAKSNGSIIPLSSELQNTQVVEILTSPSAHPHLSWLRMVKTSKARSKIRAWLEQNDDSIIIEKNVVAKKKPSLPAAESFPAASGREVPFVQQVVRAPGTDVLQVRVEDEKNMMIRFARCCRPVTGDAIIGYVSRGRGIIIHRKNCTNLANIPDFEERKIETEWENAVSVLVKRFKVDARMSADLFSEIEGAIRKRQGHLIEGRLEETDSNRLTGFFTMQLEQAGDLKAVLKNIRGIPGILSLQSLN
ncbi:MAG: HD domain-containing protein [Treponema sp.]|jgi:GTP pyrophosphokinase|nr:HD domain-containing protein [Treponema sp.]